MEEQRESNQKNYFPVADGVWGLKDIFVNVYFISTGEGWVLVDAGLKSAYEKIKVAAADLFGEDTPPLGILLTHGHFDHTASLENLLQDWNVPVYAHHLELPYLTGKSIYPPADSSVGGGLMSALADFYPNEPLDLSGTVKSLPFSLEIPILPEWHYIHTPGHSPGHISLWREKDKVLIVGDAFVTTKQESALSTMMQIKVLSGPPKYFTCNWEQARHSVEQLAGLKPEIVATGHGKPMRGAEMQQNLMRLAANFDKMCIPAHGRYVPEPAVTNEYGIVSLPPKTPGMPERIALGAGLVALAGLGYAIGNNLAWKRKLLSSR
ncbi:MBL fold metallo-hydrolase [Dyadobacter luticola]|uniref:MBL fold metallo-hydrolase n=1 Tax=Dyadobacter luticola TaxID=1979387 RepID=A0A5R9L5X9_9BACT|nr:MBL fold metallo-hydrolase [Dyadobacter luticola]TLV03966.1 MBL fold metallo-hydrolase [Dyadobacter luticola]